MNKILVLILGGFLVLNLAAAASSMVVESGETKQFTFDDVDHELTLRYVDGGAAITLNDKETNHGNELEGGDIFSEYGVKIVALEVSSGTSSSKGYLNFTFTEDVPNICEEVSSQCATPIDLDKDGFYEDINGDEEFDFTDVRILWKAYNQGLDDDYSGLVFYDFSGDGHTISTADVQSLITKYENQEDTYTFGFEKSEGDWKDEQGHYEAFILDINDDGYVNFEDVSRHINQEDSLYGQYDPSSLPEELNYDYNCDTVVNKTDSIHLFTYALTNGDYSLGELNPGCDYDEDGTAYHEEKNSSNFDPKDLDNDGFYEDVNGDSAFDVGDVQKLQTILENEEIASDDLRFDFSQDDTVDQEDVDTLFDMVGGETKNLPTDQLVNVTEGESLSISSSETIEIVNVGRTQIGKPVLSVDYEGSSVNRSLRVQGEPEQLSDFSNYRIDVCGLYDDGNAPVIVSDSMSCDDVDNGPDLTCSDVDNSDVAVIYDKNGDGEIGTQELSDAIDDWQGDDLETGKLRIITTAWEKSCSISQNDKPSNNNLNLVKGWNMVSIPEGTSGEIGGSCDLRDFDGDQFWSLQASGWERTSTMKNPSKGYLTYAISSCNAELMPLPSTTSSLDLSKGWNTVSVPREISLSSPNNDCEFVGKIWSLNSQGFSWEKISLEETLSPTKGYYVKTASQCSVNYE